MYAHGMTAGKRTIEMYFHGEPMFNASNWDPRPRGIVHEIERNRSRLLCVKVWCISVWGRVLLDSGPEEVEEVDLDL